MAPLTHPAKKNGPGGQHYQGRGVVLLVLHILSQFCPKSNLIKDKIPVLGLDIVERQV